jgi:CubicO group peptidase (beta-lactamase class C family)
MGRPRRLSSLVPLAVCLAAFPLAAGAQQATKEKVLAALPKLEAFAKGITDKDGVPGLSIAVIFDDEVVFLKGFGVREEGKPDPVDPDTVFQLASFSKPIASTVVAALVSEGSVTWDTRIADIDPTFRLFDAYPTAEVTVRDLLSHRSGLPGNAGNELESIGYDRDEILRRLRSMRPASSFRSAYSYSNFGFTEGAVAAAKAAGLSWEEAAEEKLYKPLGMTMTSSRYADLLTRGNRAVLHVPYNGKWQALAKREPDAQSPAGGVSSTARDLAQWMRLELANGKLGGKQLIEEKAIAATHVPQIERGKNPVSGGLAFYGLGWNVEFGRYGVVWGHAGAFSTGARTVVNLIPSERIGIVVLANAFPTGVPEGVADAFFDMVFRGEPERDWVAGWNALFAALFGPTIDAAKAKYGNLPADARPALPTAAYVGTYANEYLGEAVVTADGDSLSLKLGPGGKKGFPLKHFDRDLFTYTPYGEMPDAPFAVTFQIGSDGKASEVTIEDLNDLGQGTLTRVP